jgi:hypothetical protein
MNPGVLCYWHDISSSRRLTITSRPKNKNDFPTVYIKKLLKEAYANSLSKVKDKKQIMKGKTMVKSISEKKRTVMRKITKSQK